jgi:hypothetical protein
MDQCIGLWLVGEISVCYSVIFRPILKYRFSVEIALDLIRADEQDALNAMGTPLHH